MRAQCSCGIRHRVTAAQCGRTIRCGCGQSLEVPSLRQLKLSGAEHLIVDKFDDPDFWNQNGCYLCERRAETPFGLEMELAAPVYEVIAVGPERRSAPILSAIVGALFGGLAGHAVRAVDAATQKTERVLTSEGKKLEVVMQCCTMCSSRDDLQQKVAEKIAFDPLFMEIKEDYPGVRVVKLVV